MRPSPRPTSKPSSATEHPVRILQVSAYDHGGGAETVARGLHGAYRRLGEEPWLAVGRRRDRSAVDEGVFEIPAALNAHPLRKAALLLAGRLEASGAPGAGALRLAARPGAAWARWRGREDFDFPLTNHLGSLVPGGADVLHAHNLHGYFDLRALPILSMRMPVVLTLHDCWTFTGHCAHPFDCRRWESGCGNCPDLAIPPAIRRDSTAENWALKKTIYSSTRLNIAVPSLWLKEQVSRSMLGIENAAIRMIPNGIDDRFFEPITRAEARRRLGFPPDLPILLFAANTVRENIWKDFMTLRAALGIIAERSAGDLRLIALGEDAPDEAIGRSKISFVPFERDPARVALYYRAADLYLHASHAETFSLTIAEAMACGLPVIATAVGAVVERVRSLAHPTALPSLSTVPAEEATGILVGAGDAEGMAAATLALMARGDLRARLGENAHAVATREYRMASQARAYVSWFNELLAERAHS